jgi:hypothetical protein
MVSRFFIGGKITKVELSNIDLANILPKVTSKPFSIHKYGDLTYDHQFMYWTVLLYQYPKQIGHWVQALPEPPHVLASIIKRYIISDGYTFTYNTYNIQGTIRNSNIKDSECGEFVVLRILFEDMSDAQFYSLCMRLGGHQIFKIVKEIDEGKKLR